MKAVLENFRFWLAGLLMAAMGIFLARGGSIELTGFTRLVAVVSGQCLALIGLFGICLGVSRRVRRASGGEHRS